MPLLGARRALLLAKKRLALNTYVANGVNFDGSTTYLTRGGALTGAADNKTATVSVWVRAASGGDGTNRSVFGADDGSQEFRVQLDSNNRFIVNADNSAGTEVFDARTSNGSLHSAFGWRHCICSFDLATGAKHIYLDDVSDYNQFTFTDDETVDWTLTSWAVGADDSGSPGALMNGDVADLWVDNSYIDLSVAANRRKFIDGNGKPVDLGSDGSSPTGVAPLVFLSGETASWHTNKGTGGGFSETGSLTDASSGPSA